VHPRGHEKVPGALWRATGEHWRLDLEEAVVVLEAPAHLAHGRSAEAQVALHLGPTQVENTVAQARFFVGCVSDAIGVRHGKRKAPACPGEKLHIVDDHLDSARGHVRVGVSAGDDFTGDADAALEAEFAGCGVGGVAGPRKGLDDARVVANSEKEDSAQVADAVDPATH